MIKLFYKPVGMLVSVLGGTVAGAIFKRVWKVTAGEENAPNATDAQTGVWPGDEGQQAGKAA